MSFLSLRIVFTLFGGMLLLSPLKRINPDGYSAVIRYEDGFMAASSGGRLDIISVSGKVLKSEIFQGENFNSMLSCNQLVIVAGDNGTILISSEGGKFRKVDSGTNKNINSLALFNGKIIAGADQGEIVTGDGREYFRNLHLALKGNIVSVSASTSECYGVTDEGEIIHSADGINWNILDFNQTYSGFYKPCYFTRVLVTENRISIAGIQKDGTPVFLLSNQGNVWIEKTLYYTDDQEIPGFLTDSPNDIFYDASQDQFFLACTKGKLMKLPSCSQCNKLAILTEEDLTGISSNENTMLIVGGNFFIKAINLK